jgi:exodeoxyribonuclease-5
VDHQHDVQKVMTDINLTAEQREAYYGALTFVDDPWPSQPAYNIQGLAGTGKTVVLNALAARLPHSIVCAFTAKAASVLRTRGCANACTVHSVIYNFLGLVEDDLGKTQPVFRAKGDPLAKAVILLDESSMIGGRIGRDLEATGARIITTGDLGQLQPVGDTQHFVQPDVTLSTIHRQALESPIIRQAHAVRNQGDYTADTDDFRVVTKSTPEQRQGADIALCWKNNTRRVYNRVRRSELGLSPTVLKAGEPLMCLRNNHPLQVYNGVIYTTVRNWSEGNSLHLREELTGREIAVLNPTIESFSTGYEEDRLDDSYLPLAPAYAATVHKSQGSEWDSVLFIDEHPRGDAWRSFAYTAITRASKRIVVVRRT